MTFIGGGAPLEEDDDADDAVDAGCSVWKTPDSTQFRK